MFDLVGKRYIFLIISLVIIIPGTISLAIKGLNVGIDFAGGTTIEFRPDKNINIAEMQALLKPLNLAAVQVVTGNNASLPGNQTVWVRLNTQVDGDVQNTIKGDLQKKYGSQLSVLFDNLSIDGKTTTVVTVTKFSQAPTISDIQGVLAKLPNTSDATRPTNAPVVVPATPTVGITPTVGSTATPVASPTAGTTPTAGGTATPVASATPTTNPAATIPVTAVDVRQGTTTETITVLTSSAVDRAGLLKIEATVFKGNGTYVQLLDNALVTGSVAGETTRNALLAVLAASLFILFYIRFSFRKVARPWRYGTCAIIALLHDVLVVLGVFSILGWTLHIQVNALFITAVLTVVGFSVHDTIVVFDRIRENMQRRGSETFEQVVNASLVQTLARSLNTSLTVLITLSALTLFGGTTIRDFTLTLLIGIFSGTYSSIFNASMLLVIWEKGELGTDRLSRNRTTDRREERELARTR